MKFINQYNYKMKAQLVFLCRLYLVVLSFGLLQQSALAYDRRPYFGHENLNLTKLLPSPPSNNTAISAELAIIRALQDSTSADRIEQAIADDGQGLRAFISQTTLSDLDISKVPLTSILVQRILDTQDAVTSPAKIYYNRQRPPLLDQSIKPAIPLLSSGSYPSGHAAGGRAVALILAEMIPAKREELIQRSYEYAVSRIVLGVHYPSDIIAGLESGDYLTKRLLKDSEFLLDLERATEELRRVMDDRN